MVFGLTSKKPLPITKPERIIALKELVREAFLRIKPDYDGEILYIQNLFASGNRIPAVECRINSIEKAVEIRKACGKVRSNKAKANQYVWIANVVTSATKV